MTAASIPAILRGLLDLPPAGSTIADEVDALHVAVITTTMIGSTAIAAVAAYFILRYRRRSDTQLTQHFVTGTPLELSFAVGTLGLFIAFWLIGYHQYVEIEVPPKDAMLVYVQAKQWMWKFTYPDGRSTNDVLVAPAETNVRLVMGSRDVIHSFYVPGFRVKQDIVPGRYVTAWFRSDRPGTYSILCAELCGVGHSMMRGSVVVLAKPDYDAWLGHAARLARRTRRSRSSDERPLCSTHAWHATRGMASATSARRGATSTIHASRSQTAGPSSRTRRT
jgi:cytochrome c oxidase subunit 2